MIATWHLRYDKDSRTLARPLEIPAGEQAVLRGDLPQVSAAAFAVAANA